MIRQQETLLIRFGPLAALLSLLGFEVDSAGVLVRPRYAPRQKTDAIEIATHHLADRGAVYPVEFVDDLLRRSPTEYLVPHIAARTRNKTLSA